MTLIRPKVQMISFPSRFTAETTEHFYGEIQHMIDGGSCSLILDMSSEKKMDSAKLAILVEAVKHARSLGGEIALLRPRPLVRTVLELTRMHRLVDIFEHEAAAICRLGGSFGLAPRLAA